MDGKPRDFTVAEGHGHPLVGKISTSGEVPMGLSTFLC